MGNKQSKKKVMKRYDRWAPIYDLMHHLQTMWQDTRYRTDVSKFTTVGDKATVLDLGTGTAETLLEMRKAEAGSIIIGLDLSQRMLKQAREKLRRMDGKDRLSLVLGDMENMPFADDSFDAVISVYGTGAVLDAFALMREVVRVSKPGARITMAEMSSPPRERKVRSLMHRCFVEPWVKFWWYFWDLDLVKLYNEHGVKIDSQKYYATYLIGSTSLVSGTVQKAPNAK